jgi:hypothetical protein
MNAIPAFDFSTADELVSAAWRSNCLAGDLFHAVDGGWHLDARLLAERVATLLPKMPANKKDAYVEAFSKSWPKVGCLCHGQNNPINWAEIESESLGVLFDGLYQIAISTRSVARSVDKLILQGEKVAYPAEMELMRAYPFQFGSPRIPGLIVSQIRGLVLTHRQLALHVEFAPLVAAVYLASKMPRSIINGAHMPSEGSRPFLSRLVATLAARCPENMDDDSFKPYLRWLLETQDPMTDEYGVCLIG